MHVYKWTNPRYYMAFAASDDGGGVGSTPSPSGGDSGSSVAATPAADGGGSDAGTASPLPASAPAASPATTPTDMGWGALGSTDDLDHIEIPPEPKAPVVPAEVPPVQPVVPPSAVPAPEPATPPQAATEAQPPTQDGDNRPLTASDPWRIATGLEAHRAEVIAHLAGTKFALSEDEVKALDADPASAVPQLLSRVFLESQVSMQKFLAQAVPGMIKQYNTVTTANEGAEKKFFDSHKALDIKNPQHRATAVRIATLYRQANPGIPLDQLIAEVGPMVMASLRLNASATPTNGGKQPVIPRGGTGFRPAVNGGGGAPIATEPASEWGGLGQQFD